VVLFVAVFPRPTTASERLPAGTWFVRVQNPADSGRAICVRAYFNPNQPPWKGDLAYLAGPPRPEPEPAATDAGGEAKSTKTPNKSTNKKKPRPRGGDAPPPESQWLAPGETSDWFDISPFMSRFPRFKASTPYLSPVLLGVRSAPAANGLRLVAELATGAGREIRRRLDVDEPRPTKLGASTWLGGEPLPTLALLVPVDPEAGQRIWTAEEAARQQLEWVKACGPPPRPPRDILFIARQWQVAFREPTELQRLNTEIVASLGYNNLTAYAESQDDLEAIRALGREPLPAIIFNAWDADKKHTELAAAGLLEQVRIVSFGDEIDISLKSSPEEQDAAFVTELRSRELNPLDFVRPADEAAARKLPADDRWQLVRLGGPLPPEKPQLFFEAATFRYRLWTRELAARTVAIKAAFPPHIETGANYSPHLSVWPDVRKWIDVFRDRGMTMPWSEDWWWQVPEASPQSYGLLVDALRHASDYHGGPWCFYTIPSANYHEGPALGSHLLRMNYFALGHQAKVINHFNIYNQIFGTCDFIDFLESEAKYRAIHRVLSEVGSIDERLAAARMRPAETGIVLSVANDVWNNDALLAKDPPVEKLYHATLNVDSHERKALWLALRHAHLPVDLVTDEDLAKGVPDRFKTLYVVGDELLSAAAGPLRAWVEAGGTLVGIGGGGVLDEYRQPQPTLLALYGLAGRQPRRAARSLKPAADLPQAAPLDTLTFDVAHGGLPLPAYCGLQQLEPAADVPVVGRFGDGRPGATDRRVGQGRACFIGALPGLAYLQPGIGGRKRGMTLDYPADVRRLIVEPAESAGVRRHVTTSDPLVEATLQEGPRGAVVTLVSFRHPDGGPVTVTLAGLPETKRVTSTRQGPLTVTPSPAGPQVTLRVDEGDFLVAD
jgi:hypothetical protein